MGLVYGINQDVVEFSRTLNNVLLPVAINLGDEAQSWAIVDTASGQNELLYYYEETVPINSKNDQIYLIFEEK